MAEHSFWKMNYLPVLQGFARGPQMGFWEIGIGLCAVINTLRQHVLEADSWPAIISGKEGTFVRDPFRSASSAV